MNGGRQELVNWVVISNFYRSNTICFCVYFHPAYFRHCSAARVRRRRVLRRFGGGAYQGAARTSCA
jgi:hypothetical protein